MSYHTKEGIGGGDDRPVGAKVSDLRFWQISHHLIKLLTEELKPFQ